MRRLVDCLLGIKRRTYSEGCLGLIQIYAQSIGSTTLLGAGLYEFLAVGWWIWLFTGRMWGFLPISIAGSIMSTWNLYQAIQGV